MILLHHSFYDTRPFTHAFLGAEVAPCVSPGNPRVTSSARCFHAEHREAPLDESGSSPSACTENSRRVVQARHRSQPSQPFSQTDSSKPRFPERLIYSTISSRPRFSRRMPLIEWTRLTDTSSASYACEAIHLSPSNKRGQEL